MLARPNAIWKRLRALAFVACCVLPGCSDPTPYTAEPITATVVDAETLAPLEDVNIVAAWESRGGLEGGNYEGYVMVMETVTDRAGQFHFPGWGPKINKTNGLIRGAAPLLMIFKTGYESMGLDNQSSGAEWAPHHMRSDWNGKTIKLRRFPGTAKEYDERLSWISIKLDSLLMNKECNWKAIPRFLAALSDQHKSLKSKEPSFSTGDLDSLDRQYSGNCGPLKSYVGSYAAEHRK